MTAETKIACDEVKGDSEDDESFLEKCFWESSKNVSRKWLIRDASYKRPPSPWYSTMKDTYRYPKKEEVTKPIGARKQRLLKKFQEEAVEEVTLELNKPPPEEVRLSEYEVRFDMCGFRPDDEHFKRKPELYQKFPLYSSMPVSYYSYNLNKIPKTVLHGHTNSPSVLHPFKKNAGFSKDIREELDCSMR